MPTYQSRPYDWPYDNSIDPGHLAIVVAGAQSSMIARTIGGTFAAKRISIFVNDLAKYAVPTFLITHVSHRLSSTSATIPSQTFLPGESAIATEDPSPSLPAAPFTRSVLARGVDGFYNSPLEQILRADGRTHLLLCGFGTELAVDSTLRGANDRGFECLVLTDLVSPFDSELAKHALASVTMSGGIFGALATSDFVLQKLHANLPRERPLS